MQFEDLYAQIPCLDMESVNILSYQTYEHFQASVSNHW